MDGTNKGPGTFYLHSLHSWSLNELRDIKDILTGIGQQNASTIKYDHTNFVFTIEGDDPDKQQKALIELHMLIEEKRPQQPKYPRGPFRDVLPRTSSMESLERQSNSVSEPLIQMGDMSISSHVGSVGAVTSGARHKVEFRIDDRVENPHDMYYADKKQKKELPIIIGERHECEVEFSDEGRLITISGHNSASVNKCVSRLKQMQEYYLRPRFILDRVALVYGSSRDEFRLQFVPVEEHSYYSENLKYLPSSFYRVNIRHLCVIEKALFDSRRSMWALPDGIRLAPFNHSPKGSNPQTFQQGPQRQPNSSFSNPNREWHEQDTPEFGFGPTRERATSDKPSRQGTWRPLNSPTLQQPRSQPAWQSSGPSGSQRFQSGSSSQSRVQRMAQPEWSAPTFEDRKENDFPALGGTSKNPSKIGFTSGQSSQTRRGQSSSPNNSGFNSWEQNTRNVEPAENSIIFADQDLDYLENLHNQRSTKPSRRENDDIALALVNIRDPAREREDHQRVYRTLPNQKASPGPLLPQQIVPTVSFITGMRNYNMRRLSESIRTGLKELRGQRKEIRLAGRLGCVLYPIDGFILNKLWEYTQLESIVVKERDIKPIFSPIATTRKQNVNDLFGFLGNPINDTAYFEIECDTRNNPTSKFERTIVSVPTTMAILDRVVTPWNTYGEVIWNAVEKHMDFEILLQAREGIIHDTKSALGRTDVKPFSTFRKSISIGTHNSHITCQDVKSLLEVRGIKFRRTCTYESPDKTEFNYVIHEIEELELRKTQGIGSFTAKTGGEGKKWFEFEVYNPTMNNKLIPNLTLTPGTVAEWTVEDIIGQSEDSSEELLELVKSLMLLVDKCQEMFIS